MTVRGLLKQALGNQVQLSGKKLDTFGWTAQIVSILAQEGWAICHGHNWIDFRKRAGNQVAYARLLLGPNYRPTGFVEYTQLMPWGTWLSLDLES